MHSDLKTFKCCGKEVGLAADKVAHSRRMDATALERILT
jgi:hypothetical protein